MNQNNLDDYIDLSTITLSPSNTSTATSPVYTINSNTWGSGQILQANGTGAYAWAPNMNDTITITSAVDTYRNTLQVNGDANFEGDVKIQGKSIADSLEQIEERLAILRPNEELEEKWEQLRGLRNAYKELEAELIEKEKMWSILKR